jgi:hypothetical protein
VEQPAQAAVIPVAEASTVHSVIMATTGNGGVAERTSM